MRSVIDSPSSRPDEQKRSYAKLSKLLTEPGLDLRANERLVALVIFQHVNLETMTCYPSTNSIARRAKVGRNAVSKATKKLVALGLMTISKERNAGQYSRNVYDFHLLLRKQPSR